MTVSELIEILKDLPEDMEVSVYNTASSIIYSLTKAQMMITEKQKQHDSELLLFSGGCNVAEYKIQTGKIKGKLIP